MFSSWNCCPDLQRQIRCAILGARANRRDTPCDSFPTVTLARRSVKSRTKPDGYSSQQGERGPASPAIDGADCVLHHYGTTSHRPTITQRTCVGPPTEDPPQYCERGLPGSGSTDLGDTAAREPPRSRNEQNQQSLRRWEKPG